jgi:hypothetical protein
VTTVEKPACFEVPAADLDAFLTTLLLGTLEAMRSGSWPLEAGIWTLGRPIFREPLERAGVHEELAAILREIDELSALEALRGRNAADARLDTMIATVRHHLASTAVNLWRVTVREHDASEGPALSIGTHPR